MKALEAKGYINMGLNADNQRENYFRERLQGAGASAEEIEKVLKEARLEKFKKAIRTPQSLDQRLQQVMASMKPSQTVKTQRIITLPIITLPIITLLIITLLIITQRITSTIAHQVIRHQHRFRNHRHWLQ